MKAVMTKRGGVLIPADAEARAMVDSIRDGKDVMVEDPEPRIRASRQSDEAHQPIRKGRRRQNRRARPIQHRAPVHQRLNSPKEQHHDRPHHTTAGHARR